MKVKAKKISSVLLAVMVLMGSFTGFFDDNKSFAEGEVERVHTEITEFKITYTDESTPSGGFNINRALLMHINWDASVYQNQLKEGDYFNITLPKEFIFPNNHAACNFPVKDPEKVNVVANAVVTPKPGGGGNIKVIFTKYVENKFNIKGNMYLQATFNQTYIKQGEKYEVEISVGSSVKKLKFEIAPPYVIQDEVLNKWPSSELTPEGYVSWVVRINHKKGNLANVVISDQLEAENGNLDDIHYVPGSFKLEERHWDQFGQNEPGTTITETNISDQVQISNNGTAFSYTLGNVAGKQYMLHYKTTYKTGLKLKNTVKLKYGDIEKIISFTFNDATSGGEGSGDLTSKIKIIKVDAEKNEIKLKNAKFKITKVADNTSFELTTGDDGEILSDALIPGKYKIKEIGAPAGYLLNETEYEVEVKSDGACIQTIKNEPVKTNITVKKQWEGQEGPQITAILKADGTEIARHDLEAPSWSYTFENLRKYKPGTDKEIKYTVEEEVVPAGYEVSYETDSTGALVIKNKAKDITIKAKKTWVNNGYVGPKKDLYFCLKNGDNTVPDTTKKVEGTDWVTWTVPKYDNNNIEINYTVAEVDKDGNTWADGQIWTTGISGTMADGFTITNTYNPPKIDVQATKVWNGGPSTHPTVWFKLYRKVDGGSVEVVAGADIKELANGTTQVTWSGLDKFDNNGNEYKYSVKEVKADGAEFTPTDYTKIENDLTVTNIYSKTVDVEGAKTWDDVSNQDGMRPTEIKINLMKQVGDGTVEKKETKTVTVADGWKWSWKGLPEYEDGKKITYSITEEAVAGYTTKINGYNVTNSHTPGRVSVVGVKTWDDKDDRDGKRPNEIIVNLLANGTKIREIKVTATDGWKYSFNNLPAFENGQWIIYSVTENAVKDYNFSVEGYNIKNTYTPKETSVTVTKRWKDNNNKYYTRPESIKVQLYANGSKEGEAVELNADNKWSYTWNNLPEKDKGKEIKYTVKEVGKIKGYKVKIDNKDHGNIIITNTLKPEKPTPLDPKKPNEPPSDLTPRYPNVPDVPEEGFPRTDDITNLHLYACLLVASGSLITLIGYKRRRNKR